MSLIIQEIESLRKVDHPNIIKLHELYETKEKVFLVQELLRGTHVLNRIKELENFPEELAIIYLKQILQAIAFLH
jgi:calcium/calmodulin-dependent protein kinase I